LIWYTDPNAGDPVDGLIYEGTTFQNCSVGNIDFYQPLSDYFNLEVISFVRFLLTQTQVYVLCNTSEMQWFEARTGYDVASGTKVPEQAFNLLNYDQLAQSPGPLNITSVVELWGVVTMAMMYLIATPRSISFLLPSVAQNNLSSIHLEYWGNIPI
jgi:hypothetical protein